MTDTLYAWSQTASSNATADATINWAEFQTPSSVNDSARSLMKRVAELVSDLAPKRASTGSANAYVVASDAAGATLRDGEMITFVPNHSCTGACTLNVDGRGAKPWRPKSGTSFAADNILSGVPVTAYYASATDEWLSPGTGYYVSSMASGVSLQSITARLPQIGDLVISYAPTPGAGRIRLTESTQSLLKSAYPELNTYLSGISYPWGSTATHFSLPPAAGYFLRVASTTSAVDTSGARTAGSTQSDQNKAHTHTVSATGTTAVDAGHTHTTTASVNSFQINSSGNGANSASTAAAITSSTSGSHSHTVTVTGTAASDGGDEVRVKNIAFHLDVVASTALSATQVAVFGFPYQWDSTITAGDPGTGRVRGNSATLSAITALYLSDTDGWDVDLSGIISGWENGSIINLSKVGAQANRVVFVASGAPTDNGDYYTVPGAVVASAGTLSNSDQMALEYTRDGTDGITVPDISGLTADASPDPAADYLITYDASAAVHKKVLFGKSNPMTTRGDIIRRGASDAERLALGTSGYMLASDGTDAVWSGFVQAGAGASTRTWQSKARDVVSVKDFGAVGDGTTDDYTAFSACIDALVTAGGGTMYVPSGTYRIKTRLAKNISGQQSICIVGDGARVSVLDWSDAGGAGGVFFNSTTTTANQKPTFSFSNIGFVTSIDNAGPAIRCDWYDAATLDPTIIISNVFIGQNVDRTSDTGSGYGYWSIGVHGVNARVGRIAGLHFYGEMDKATDTTHGIYLAGESTDFKISESLIFEATTGIEATGTSEGLNIDQTTITQVVYGVRHNVSALEPQCNFTNGHIAASNVCVWLQNSAQSVISGNLFYATSALGAPYPTWYGVLVQGTYAKWVRVTDNAFSKESGRTADTTHGIDFNQGSYFISANNQFFGHSGNELSYGIIIRASVTNVVIYDRSEEMEYVTSKIDDSGTGTIKADDFARGPSASIDGEIVLYDSTTGKKLKRLSASGLIKSTSGVASAAVAGTDYYAPGGADVAIADGGTGASTAAGALTALGVGTGDTPTFAGLIASGANDAYTLKFGGVTGKIRCIGYLTSFGGSYIEAANAAESAFQPIGFNGSYVSFLTSGLERIRLTAPGNFKIGGLADRATTEGTNQIVLFNGTAPVGTLVDGVSLYSASGECRVMDAAGNSTLLSPHDRETNEWIYDSVDTRTGRRLTIKMERMLKALNDQFGWDYVTETE